MLDIPLSPSAASPTAAVVLLDARGRPCGTAPKHAVHNDHTPLHLAFSCYVVDDAGRVLLTRRAAAKRTWPSTWTNACCGHPLPGETLRQAVTRHLRDELGVTVGHLAVALPDFAYRATMFDGTVEHELCPVVVATIIGDVVPHPTEADAAEWVEWAVLVARAVHAPATLSPWSVHQIAALDSTIGHPASWLAARPHSRALAQVACTARAPGTPALDPFGGRLEARLDDVIDARIARLRALDERAAVIGETLGGLIRRSAKRLRPAFVHWGHVAGGGDGRGVEVSTSPRPSSCCTRSPSSTMTSSTARRRGVAVRASTSRWPPVATPGSARRPPSSPGTWPSCGPTSCSMQPAPPVRWCARPGPRCAPR